MKLNRISNNAGCREWIPRCTPFFVLTPTHKCIKFHFSNPMYTIFDQNFWIQLNVSISDASISLIYRSIVKFRSISWCTMIFIYNWLDFWLNMVSIKEKRKGRLLPLAQSLNKKLNYISYIFRSYFSHSKQYARNVCLVHYNSMLALVALHQTL